MASSRCTPLLCRRPPPPPAPPAHEVLRLLHIAPPPLPTIPSAAASLASARRSSSSCSSPSGTLAATPPIAATRVQLGTPWPARNSPPSGPRRYRRQRGTPGAAIGAHYSPRCTPKIGWRALFQAASPCLPAARPSLPPPPAYSHRTSALAPAPAPPPCRECAWGQDELQPLSCSGVHWLNLSLTMVDSLDTLYLLGMRAEFEEAAR